VELTQRCTNVPDAQTDGFDVEIVTSLMEDGLIDGDNLVMELNYGEIDTEYKSFRTRFSSTFGIGVPALGRICGLTIGYAK
jgi:hypothetical protein